MNINDFSNDFSSSAFRTIDGARRIVGKFCEIEAVGTAYDVWLVKPSREPISKRKMNSLLKAIAAGSHYNPDGLIEGWQIMDNGSDGVEAHCQSTDRALVAEIGIAGGVRKRTTYSEATKQAMRERMAKIHGDKS